MKPSLQDEISAILNACELEFPDSGFLIIKTDVNPEKKNTEVHWKTNIRKEDLGKVFRSFMMMSLTKPN